MQKTIRYKKIPVVLPREEKRERKGRPDFLLSLPSIEDIKKDLKERVLGFEVS